MQLPVAGAPPCALLHNFSSWWKYHLFGPVQKLEYDPEQDALFLWTIFSPNACIVCGLARAYKSCVLKYAESLYLQIDFFRYWMLESDSVIVAQGQHPKQA